jgi:hypothetical protein
MEVVAQYLQFVIILIQTKVEQGQEVYDAVQCCGGADDHRRGDSDCFSYS